MAYTGQCHEQYAAWLQNPIKSSDRLLDIEYKHQSLRADDAIKAFGRNVLSSGQILNNRCPRVTFNRIKNIALNYPGTAKSTGIRIVADLKHRALNISVVCRQKSFDVIPIDRQATIEAPY